MDLHDDAAEGLPLPRDDEPESLRQDLVDELADHLDCAMQRELSKRIDAGAAEQNVRRRFGDPRSILRKLWFDAMKEKIMSQRLTLALVFVLALSTIGATAFAWMAVREGRDASAAMASAMRDSNAALVERLIALSPSRSETPALAAKSQTGWAPLKFKLALDDKDGPPATGYKAKLSELSDNNYKVAIEKTSSSNGELDFGRVPAGNYLFELATPWGESSQEQKLIPPDEPFQETIACPSKPIAKTDVSFKLEGLTGLAEKKAIIRCLFSGHLGRAVEGLDWDPGPLPFYAIYFDSTGRFFYADSINYISDDGPFSPTAQRRRIALPAEVLRDFQDSNATLPTVKFETAQFSLRMMQVIAVSSLLKNDSEAREQDCGLAITKGGVTSYTRALPAGLQASFVASDQQPNVWTLKLPGSLIREAKDLIAEQEQVDARETEARALKLPEFNATGVHRTEALLTTKEFFKRIGIDRASYSIKLAPGDRYSFIPDGLSIQSLNGESAAVKAGLREQDYLFGLGSWFVTSDEFKNLVIAKDLPMNKPLKYYVLRNGEIVSGELTIPEPIVTH